MDINYYSIMPFYHLNTIQFYQEVHGIQNFWCRVYAFNIKDSATMIRSSYAMQESLADTNIPQFQQEFPIDILNPLLKWLTSSQQASFREVCKSFKKEIDNNIGCEIYIDETNFGAKHGLAPPASKLHLINISPIYNVKMLLNYPQMITSISLEGSINSNNFIQLLKLSRNLQRLILIHDFHITAKTPESAIETPVLRSLVELRILYKFSKNKIQPPETTWQNILYLLSRVDMPNLETLFMSNFSDCPIEFEKSIHDLSRFIIKSQYTLKHLYLNLRRGQDCSHQHNIPFSHPKLRLNVSEDDLKNMDLDTFVVHCDKPIHQIMDSVLLGVKSLTRLEYEKPWASWFFYSPIIIMNSGALRCIKLSNAASPLDMSTFGPCCCLEVLHLCKEQLLSRDNKKTAGIKNMEMLPKNLQEFHIINYSVDSLELFTIRRLKMLRNLHLEFLSARSTSDTGVTAGIIRLLLTRYRQLEELFIQEYHTYNTNLDDIMDSLRQINMVRSSTVRRLGFERWAIAIAPARTIETWKSKLFPYENVNDNVTE